MSRASQKKALDLLQSEARDLYLGSQIKELFEIPTSIDFLRDYVAKNVPVIIRSANLNWPAVTKWNSHYFRDHLGEKEVVVAMTPNGYADGITRDKKGNEYFVMPEERVMEMNEFLDMLDNKGDAVPYIQKQNSNLTTDFAELLDDLPLDGLKFAYEAFNKEPDAVNFWMGDGRAITSMHKDPYENIYCVVSGHKDFILIPPVSYHNVPRRKFPSAVFKTSEETGVMDIEPIIDQTTKKPVEIDWVDVDPLEPDLKRYPEFSSAIKYEFRINEGDMLYLPSLWYHHVRQSHKCIATNFWFDQDYDARYCYFRMVEELCNNNSDSNK